MNSHMHEHEIVPLDFYLIRLEVMKNGYGMAGRSFVCTLTGMTSIDMISSQVFNQ